MNPPAEPAFRIHDYILSLRRSLNLRLCRIDHDTEEQDKTRNFHAVRFALLRAAARAEPDTADDGEIPYPFTAKLTPAEMMAAVLRVTQPPEVELVNEDIEVDLRGTADAGIAYVQCVLEEIEAAVARDYAYRYVPSDVRLN